MSTLVTSAAEAGASDRKGQKLAAAKVRVPASEEYGDQEGEKTKAGKAKATVFRFHLLMEFAPLWHQGICRKSHVGWVVPAAGFQ